MRPEDKRALREEVIELFRSYEEDPAAARRRARELHATHKGQISLLEEDLARAIQVLEELAYAEKPVDEQTLRETLDLLEKARR